ncbi:MAG: hypothetical protein U0936_12985 [Planctomycetaceae bacterium]
MPAAEHSDTFLTATSARFKDAQSIVALLEIFNGKPSGQASRIAPRRSLVMRYWRSLRLTEHHAFRW